MERVIAEGGLEGTDFMVDLAVLDGVSSALVEARRAGKKVGESGEEVEPDRLLDLVRVDVLGLDLVGPPRGGGWTRSLARRARWLGPWDGR